AVAPACGERVRDQVGVALGEAGRVPVDAAAGGVRSRVDQHEPALGRVVGPQRRIVGRVHVAGGGGHRGGDAAQGGVELGVVVAGEEDPVGGAGLVPVE